MTFLQVNKEQVRVPTLANYPENKVKEFATKRGYQWHEIDIFTPTLKCSVQFETMPKGWCNCK